jgi:hypothetical protein
MVAVDAVAVGGVVVLVDGVEAGNGAGDGAEDLSAETIAACAAWAILRPMALLTREG